MYLYTICSLVFIYCEQAFLVGESTVSRKLKKKKRLSPPRRHCVGVACFGLLALIWRDSYQLLQGRVTGDFNFGRQL